MIGHTDLVPATRRAAAVAVFALLVAAVASAQTTGVRFTAADDAQPGAGRPAPPPAAKAPAPAHRWYEAQAIQLDARYRLIDTSAGVRSSNHLQHRQTCKGASCGCSGLGFRRGLRPGIELLRHCATRGAHRPPHWMPSCLHQRQGAARRASNTTTAARSDSFCATQLWGVGAFVG